MLERNSLLENRYEIIKPIGRGGMAVVYKAYDLELGRNVAIKVLDNTYSNDHEFIKRFNTEASASAQLNHPNIVKVFDVGVDKGLHYIVMEYVKGNTLKEIIASQSPLSSEDVCKIAMQIAMGINDAHIQGIIHRDIKPQNIVLSDEGVVKVADFGIAKVATGETINNNVIGSVHYIAPEQARSGYSDERSDIYSLGITMYEMATGRVPFDGEHSASVLYSQFNRPIIRPSDIVPDIYPGLEQIILKATNKHSDSRYQSMEELIDDLQNVLEDPNYCVNDYSDLNDEFEDEDLYEDDSSEVVNPKIKKVMNVITIIGGLVVGFILIFIIAKLSLGNHNITSKDLVPNLISLKYDKAKEIANEAGFSIVITKYDKDAPESEKDKILSQDPKADTKWNDSNRVINVVVAGNDDIILPDFSNRPKDQVMNELQRLKLSADIQETYDDHIDKGFVVKTNPVGGSSIPKNATITIYISKGAKTIKMIDIVGQSKEEAENALKDQEINYTIESIKGEKNKVIKTDPIAGTSMQKSKTVTIYVGDGKGTFKIPDVIGRAIDRVVNFFKDKKVKVKVSEVEDDSYPNDTVIKIDPEVGASISEGDTVTIYGNSNGENTIPFVVGLDYKEAISKLKDKGFNVEAYYTNSIQAKNTVVEQSIPPGSKKRKGTVVKLKVSNGK